MEAGDPDAFSMVMLAAYPSELLEAPAEVFLMENEVVVFFEASTHLGFAGITTAFGPQKSEGERQLALPLKLPYARDRFRSRLPVLLITTVPTMPDSARPNSFDWFMAGE